MSLSWWWCCCGINIRALFHAMLLSTYLIATVSRQNGMLVSLQFMNKVKRIIGLLSKAGNFETISNWMFLHSNSQSHLNFQQLKAASSTKKNDIIRLGQVTHQFVNICVHEQKETIYSVLIVTTYMVHYSIFNYMAGAMLLICLRMCIWIWIYTTLRNRL